MKGKKFAEVFASLVKTVAIASVSESSDWYNYQTKEPEGLRKIYLIKHEKKQRKTYFTGGNTNEKQIKKSTLLRVSVNHVFNNSSNGVNKKL